MKKIVLLLFTMFICITITSCGESYSEADISTFLKGMASKRYIVINVSVIAEYANNADEENVWPNTNSAYVISVDSRNVYMSVICDNYPDNGFEFNNHVFIKNNNETLTRYRLDDTLQLTNQYTTSTEGVSDSVLLTAMLEEFVPVLDVVEGIELSQLTTRSYSFNLEYDDMLMMYPNAVGIMYATMSLGFYQESRYVFTYTFVDDTLEVQIEALYETEYVSQDFKMIFTISYPSTIDKISDLSDVTAYEKT